MVAGTDVYSADGLRHSKRRHPSALTQAPDGHLFGIASGGGTAGYGSAYEMTSSGRSLAAYDFCKVSGCPDGSHPYAPLLLASDGNFYGTSSGGGTAFGSGGTIFRITPGGQVTAIYSFCSEAGCPDGQSLVAPLVEGRNGNLYGGTQFGGTGRYCLFTVGGCGTLFEITKSGVLTTLYNFCSQLHCVDGYYPSLILGTDGNFYGTTNGQGSGNGTFFRLTPTGKFNTLHFFNGLSDGSYPLGIIQGTDGNFYGTTALGGAAGGGSIFKITPTGVLTSLYSFCTDLVCSDGYDPQAGLVQGTDGNFYGTTEYGGSRSNAICNASCGTIFRITPAGALTTLHDFCVQMNCPDGSSPAAALVQHTNGAFYGASLAGGNPKCGYCGIVYSLSMGLGPFVRPNPVLGKVGYTIMILGDDLAGTTGVMFNGIPATFTVQSPSLLKVTVPSGATTTTIEVTTSGSTLYSNVPFQVLP